MAWEENGKVAPVTDRVVQYANRYALTNADTGEVLGVFELDAVTGSVVSEGTVVDAELFDRFNRAFLELKNGDRDVAKAKDVTDTISGKDITSIFETDGVTVKKATQANRSTNVDNIANNDSRNNATVSFTIGDKTYNKTVNNVSQSNRATNVDDIANNDNRSNANVDFTIGDKTYKKTIDNVAHAKHAQRADKATQASRSANVDDIVNNDTTDNAVVKFTIGDNIYNKTVNNVAQANNATQATKATNVDNIVDNNDGDNAVVHFTIGDKSYEKIVNNVAHATEATNVDNFSNDDEGDNANVKFTIGDKYFSKTVNNVTHASSSADVDDITARSAAENTVSFSIGSHSYEKVIDNVQNYKAGGNIEMLANKLGELEVRGTVASIDVEIEINQYTSDYTVNFYSLTGLSLIDWGDGTVNVSLSHRYANMGRYICKIYGVTSIGNYAFASNGQLTSIIIPDGVTSIGDNAFLGCNKLTRVRLPEGIPSIGKGAFDNCKSLKDIVIPNSVTSIGAEAFRSNTELRSIVIPQNVTSIGDYAFKQNENIERPQKLIIYCEKMGKPSGWSQYWNADNCPVIWNYKKEPYSQIAIAVSSLIDGLTSSQIVALREFAKTLD